MIETNFLEINQIIKMKSVTEVFVFLNLKSIEWREALEISVIFPVLYFDELFFFILAFINFSELLSVTLVQFNVANDLFFLVFEHVLLDFFDIAMNGKHSNCFLSCILFNFLCKLLLKFNEFLLTGLFCDLIVS